jgi:hypothetical protein
MNQPTPTITIKDIRRIIKRDFSLSIHNEVMEVLEEYGSKSWQTEKQRVRMAVLKLANGNFDELKRQVEIARCDYRDVLLNAEYPLCAETMFKKLSDGETRDIYKKDWMQYQTWLKREKEQQ